MSLILKRKDVPFHLVDPSPWPLLASLSAFNLTVGGVLYMHSYKFGGSILLIGFISLVLSSFLWWRDVIRESTFRGKHTKAVQNGLKNGMLLFIVSEVMFFFAFFWAFFACSLSPALSVGCIWPPTGIDVLNPWEIPLLNTGILLLSGATCTLAHYTILLGNRNKSLTSLGLTIFLGFLFSLLQLLEYYEANFNISDGIYGSVFFMTTGFHGFHVLIGSIFLGVCLIRLLKNHFTREHHVGFELAAWYWHFVDVVWLGLFVSLYWWGGL
jgi:cytochrome c oxidase subunit 3